MRLFAAALLTSLLLAACGSEGGDSSVTAAPNASKSNDAEPQTEAGARAAATEAADLIASQDYAGSWDQFDKAGQKKISRKDYIRYGKTCDIGGAPVGVKFVRFEDDSTAVIRFDALGFKATRAMLYEDGAWRLKVSDDTLAKFKNGVDGAIAEMCG